MIGPSPVDTCLFGAYVESPVSGKRDYYEVLSVSRDADGATIKKAYRRLAVELHPDRNPGDAVAEERFKEAAEAYQVLSDEQKRATYDRYGHDAPRGGGFSDVSDIFSAFGDIFGDMFGGGGRRQPRGADIETEVTLSLKEVAEGVTRDLKVHRRVSCETCNGTGAAKGSQPEVCGPCGGSGQVVHSQGFLMITRPCAQCQGQGTLIKKPCAECKGGGLIRETEKLQVQVPAGVDDGSTLRLTGRGESPPGGGASGNLYVHIRVEPDDRFERDGADLHTRLPLAFSQAALGASLKVETLDGEVDVEVKPGTQYGDRMTLRGQGLPHLRGRGGRERGNLVVHCQIQVPRDLNKDAEAHLRAFASSRDESVSAAKPGLFGRKKKR